MNTWAVPGYTESLELGSGAGGRVVQATAAAAGEDERGSYRPCTRRPAFRSR